MNKIRAEERTDRKFELFLYYAMPMFMFFAGFALSCMISYSDGDDAFFLQTVKAHPNFFDFVEFLTRTMNGRVASTATLWVIFSQSIWLWRGLNALFMALFVVFFSKVAIIISDNSMRTPLERFIACGGFGIMGVGILGYSCLWITGSINYLWPCVTALITIYPFLKAYLKQEKVHPISYFIAAILGVWTCLAQEQFAAVIIASIALIIIFNRAKHKKLSLLHILIFLLFCAAFLVVLLSPSNASRADKEVIKWFPEYAQFTAFQKLFILLQWLANSVSHGLKWVFVLLWGSCAIIALRVKKKISFLLLAVFCFVSLISVVFPIITDVGLNELDMGKKIENAPMIQDLSVLQGIAILFWLGTVAVTFILLIKLLKNKKNARIYAVLFLASIACMAVMILSPTIYASGERVLFPSAVILLLISAGFLGKSKTLKETILKMISVFILAAIQIFENANYLLEMIGKS